MRPRVRFACAVALCAAFAPAEARAEEAKDREKSVEAPPARRKPEDSKPGKEADDPAAKKGAKPADAAPKKEADAAPKKDADAAPKKDAKPARADAVTAKKEADPASAAAPKKDAEPAKKEADAKAATPAKKEADAKPAPKKDAEPAKTEPAKKDTAKSEVAPPRKEPEARPTRAEAGSEPRPQDLPGPRSGQGDRRIEPRAEPEPEPALAEGATKQERGHKKGAAPKRPDPTLPPGSAPTKPDEEARRQIAGAPSPDDPSLAKDPELREMSEAERVLFPKPPRGARAGWSWDSMPPPADGGTFVDASGLPGGAPAGAPPPKTSEEDAKWLASLVLPNLPTRVESRVVKYLKFYRDDARGRSIARTWAKKAGRYAPAVKAELSRAGLPTDLVWLSLIESGHNPTILSSAGAAGLWQFVPESGRMYGLTVDRWVDERLDPERATLAAVRYLSDLYTRFGSWELAMAAYNMGHGGLLRAVRKFNTNDFWALSRYEAGLPWETTLYVPKILATGIVMANKKAFGLEGIEPDPAIAFDVIAVAPNTDLTDVARAAEVEPDEIRALNAQYLSGRTPPVTAGKDFTVRVPAGKGALAEQRLPRRTAAAVRESHVVKLGETIESIAADAGVPARELAALNRAAPDTRLEPGSVVLVPAGRGEPRPAGPDTEEVVVVPGRRFDVVGRHRVFYRVVTGDELAEIAAAFSVAPSDLVVWNGLDQGARLQAGMTLQVYVRDGTDLGRVRALGEHEARVLVTGSEEFFEYFEAQVGRRRVLVTAKKGETLAAIGKKYGMSAGMMERINRLPGRTTLEAGDTVVVYAPGGTESTVTGPEAPKPLAAVSPPAPAALPPLPSAAVAPNGPRALAP